MEIERVINSDSFRQRLMSLTGGKSGIHDEITHLKEQLKIKEESLLATTGAIKDCEYWLKCFEFNDKKGEEEASLNEKDRQEAEFNETDRQGEEPNG